MSTELAIIPLFSSSEGNSTLVKINGRKLLFDVGKSNKQTEIALGKTGTIADDIDAIFITHHHSDHISGIDVFGRKHHVPVYATKGTFDHMRYRCGRVPQNTDVEIEERAVVTLEDDIEICSYPTPHDANGSVCYRINNLRSGKSAVVMTDLGYVTKGMVEFSKGVDIAMLESNYDPDMLAFGPYPYQLKKRITGNGGHISNVECSQYVEYLIGTGTKKFILAHISPHNNTPALAKKTVVDYLKERSIVNGIDYQIITAEKDFPTEGFEA